ncbi:hypothetical protein [Kitasatospora sp. MBT63]|uniref:hypothetical protein n=1 Tax=Kitasatospora sp. MBT63 TaxID=1444768 RepID=UPI000539B536|nr:hypothetical protein [Kitasatospora sp. MBT63]
MTGGEWLEPALRWGAEKARARGEGSPELDHPTDGPPASSERAQWVGPYWDAFHGLAAAVGELRDLVAMPISEVPAEAIHEVAAEARAQLDRIEAVTRG